MKKGLRKKCESVFSILQTHIGSASVGDVRRACFGVSEEKQGNCDYVVKVQDYIPAFDKEVQIATLAGDQGIGPKVSDAWICTPEDRETSRQYPKWQRVLSDSRKRFRFEERPIAFLVMDFIDGLTLREWLEGDHSAQERKHMFQQIIDQIEALHKLNIQHGDLHKGNIVIDKKTQKPYLIDFGKSTALTNDFKDYRNLLVLPLFTQLYQHSKEGSQPPAPIHGRLSPPLFLTGSPRPRGSGSPPSSPKFPSGRGSPGSPESPNWRLPPPMIPLIPLTPMPKLARGRSAEEPLSSRSRGYSYSSRSGF
jgi:serine/threonine protein kinase